MKKIIIPLSLLLAAFGLSSCEDFLTKAPETTLSPDTYFSSAAELDLWANKFYNDILPGAGTVAEQNADDNCSMTLSALQKGTRTPSSKSWSEDTWKPLRNINYMLEHNRCSDLKTKQMYDGVAYFFRAWFYYDMVRQYGDLPWYDHVIGSDNKEDLNKPRDPRGYVMLKVLQDLDKAYELLPAKWSTDAVYHVSKDAALAFKSRVALFEGTFRKYHAGTAFVPQDEQTFGDVTISSEYFLRQAADAAGRLVGTRSLYTGNTMGLAEKATDASYREYFLLETAETDETILARRYSVDVLVRHGIQFDYKSQHRSASNRFVYHYLKRDGSTIALKDTTLTYAEMFENRDPRMAQTLQGPGYKAIDGDKPEQISFERTFNGYRVIKYISDSSHETATTSTTDYPLIRYAEVLLNYAEAKAELGELTKADIDATINVIRARVGMPAMTDVPTTVDPIIGAVYKKSLNGEYLSAPILEVRRERTVELFCEGFRQWDLLRWGLGAKVTPYGTGGFRGIWIPDLGDLDLDGDKKVDLCVYRGEKPTTSAPATNIIKIGDSNWTLTGGSGDSNGFLTYYEAEKNVWDEGRDYLWPIPADQRTLTGLALTQNPGWDDGLTGTTE
jgi:hypothetical protein